MTLEKAQELATARATFLREPCVVIEFKGMRGINDYDFASLGAWEIYKIRKPDNAYLFSVVQPTIL